MLLFRSGGPAAVEAHQNRGVTFWSGHRLSVYISLLQLADLKCILGLGIMPSVSNLGVD